MFKFSNSSEQKLKTMRVELQQIFRLALKNSQVDFGISEGRRSIERQKKLFAQGRTEPGKIVTYIDGENDLSDHNYNPSRAGDIYAFVNGKATWEMNYLLYLGGVITAAAEQLGFKIKWGANWDGDGILLTDQSFEDAPHFSLIIELA